jgi:hypothetical protein
MLADDAKTDPTLQRAPNTTPSAILYSFIWHEIFGVLQISQDNPHFSKLNVSTMEIKHVICNTYCCVNFLIYIHIVLDLLY